MIKHVLVVFYTRVRGLWLYFKWTVQYLFLREKTKEGAIDSISSIPFKRALYLIPHADDDLISGWSFIKKNTDRITLYYLGFTGSRSDEANTKTRRQEFIDFCNLNSINYIEAGQNKSSEIDQLLHNGEYDSVILPSYLDWHKEHRVLSEMIFEMDLENIRVIWYSVTVPLTGVACNACSQMTASEQEQKWDQFSRIYQSQHMPISRLKYQERLNGAVAGTYAAEPFFVFDSSTAFKKAMNILKQEHITRELETIQPQINDIKKIRSLTNSLISKLSL